jgi:hypothetical protein
VLGEYSLERDAVAINLVETGVLDNPESPETAGKRD